jgi:3-oxoadipate enol-lactonase
MVHSTIYKGKFSDIEYILAGSGEEVIVFIHGAGANLHQFDKQIEDFSKDFQVISLSMMGHGKSKPNRKVNQEDLSFENIASELIELLDFLDIETFHIVGNSAGGIVGLQVLRTFPIRLKTITIFGSAPKMNLPPSVVKIIHFIDKTMLKIAPIFYVHILINHASKNEETRKKLKTIVMQNDKNTIVEFRKNLGKYDYIKDIQDCALPLLIIKPQGDKEINRSLVKLEKQFKENPNIHIIELEDAGHIANVDNPKEFNTIVRSFINHHNTGSTQ